MVYIAVQIHSHSDTCKKGKNGRFHCRLLPDLTPSDRNIDRTHNLHVEENMSDWITEEPDWETSAMPKSDPSIMYWDTKRPLFEYSDIFINNDLHPDLLQILPQYVIQEIRQFSPNERNKCVEDVIKRNCYFVECSSTGSACLRCNSNGQILGAVEQARGSVFYVIKYITKDAIPLVHVVSLAAAAQEDILICILLLQKIVILKLEEPSTLFTE